jgi:hypothetical protein
MSNTERPILRPEDAPKGEGGGYGTLFTDTVRQAMEESAAAIDEKEKQTPTIPTPADIKNRMEGTISRKRIVSEPEPVGEVDPDLQGTRFKNDQGDIIIPTGEFDADGDAIVQREGAGGAVETAIIPLNDLYDNYTRMGDDDDEEAESPTVEFEPSFLTSRNDLREAIRAYNDARPYNQPMVRLEEIEKKVFENPEVADDALSMLEDMQHEAPEDVNKLEQYINDLRKAVIDRRSGIDNPAVAAYFENDLTSKREDLAELSYKRINSAMRMRLPKNRKMLNEAQEEYDESLRALGRWELAGIEGNDEHAQEARQIQATELALAEMQKLRTEVNSIEEPERASTSKKRRNLGRAGLMASSATLGIGARVVVGAGTLGVTTAIGAGVGAVTGAAVAGYRAQRDIKSGLDDKTSEEGQRSEVEALSASITGGHELDEALKSYLQSETTKAGKERRIKIAKRVGLGALEGAGFGAAGAAAGYGIAVGVEAIGNALPDSWQFWNNDVNASDGGVDTADTAVDTGAGDVPEIDPGVDEPAPPTTQDLLQQYAGDNADAALNIENGEGPYQTLQELGIPEEKWDDLFNNDELMQKLIENGDAYSLQDAGVQEHGWGWTGNELSTESAGDLYDAAGMNTPEAISMADSGLSPTYAELTPDAQEFAINHSVVADIPNGMGGEELMRELGLDSDAWYQIEADLRSNAPNDFYTMSDGHIGLSHNGALSAGGVEELLKSLKQHGYTI